MSTSTTTGGGYVPPILMQGSILSHTSAAASMSMADVELLKVRSRKFESKKKSRRLMDRLRDEEGRQELKDMALYCSVVSVAMLTGVIAMWMAESAIAYMAFIFPLVTGPYVVAQRKRLLKLPTLREEHNRIRTQVNLMQEENNILQEQNDALEYKVAELQQVEKSFNDLVERQGKDASDLLSLVNKNRKMQKKISQLMEAQALQDILCAVFQSDRDDDFKLDEDEMKMLMMRLRNHPGISVDENQLRHTFATAESTSIATLFELTKSIQTQKKGDQSQC